MTSKPKPKPKRKTTIKAYNYVYKIIQLSTGREYIGKHKTDNLNDGYMGSGTLITPAVLENPSDFVKTIIWYCDSESEMNELEATLVTEEYLLKNFPEKTFNQVPGGDIPLHVSAQWMRKLHPEKRIQTSKKTTSNNAVDLLTGWKYSLKELRGKTHTPGLPEQNAQLNERFYAFCQKHNIDGDKIAFSYRISVVNKLHLEPDFVWTTPDGHLVSAKDSGERSKQLYGFECSKLFRALHTPPIIYKESVLDSPALIRSRITTLIQVAALQGIKLKRREVRSNLINMGINLDELGTMTKAEWKQTRVNFVNKYF